MGAIEFYLPVTIVIIPDMLVINLITKVYSPGADGDPVVMKEAEGSLLFS